MINLLPPSAKQRYQLELVRRLIVLYGVGLVAISLVFVGLLYSMRLYLDILQSAVADSIATFEATPQFAKLREAERKVYAFNQQTEQVLNLQNQLVSTSNLLPELYAQLPNGIFINTISFDVEKGKLSLAGFSASRSDILAFQKQLAALPWVVSVDSPPTNILKEANSPFSLLINTKLKP